MDVASHRKLNHKQIEARIREAGLRATRPRILVYELLLELRGHHPAETFIGKLRERGIRLSRASVYNVLADFTRVGLINLTDIGPGRALYEVQEEQHHHFVCRNCGRVEDVPVTAGMIPCLEPELPDEDFHVEHAQVVFRGLCPDCHHSQRLAHHGAPGNGIKSVIRR